MQVGRSLSLSIQHQFRLNSALAVQSVQRLSSGLRLNRASDDAAALSLSTQLQAQVRGNAQAIRNAQDGVNMLRIADGAFDSQLAALQRMRELAVQGANGTLSRDDRQSLQAEVDQLKEQINAIAYGASFNGQSLLASTTQRPASTTFAAGGYTLRGGTSDPYSSTTWPGSSGYDVDAESRIQAATSKSVYGVTLAELQAAKDRVPTLMDGALRKVEGMLTSLGLDVASLPPINVTFVLDNTSSRRATFYSANENELTINLYPFYGSGVPAASGTQPPVTLEQAFAMGLSEVLMRRVDRYGTSTDGATNDVNSLLNYNGSTFRILRYMVATGGGEVADAYGKPTSFSLSASASTQELQRQAAWLYKFLEETEGQDAVRQMMDAVINDPSNGTSGSHRNQIATRVQTLMLNLTRPDGATSWTASDLESAVNTWLGTQPAPDYTSPTQGLARLSGDDGPEKLKTVELQVGANQGETLDVDFYNGTLGALGFVSMVGVTDAVTAGRSLTEIDKALAQLTQARSALGASENRLQATISRLGVANEMESMADSRMRDADIATEMASYTRSQVLSNASIGQLAALHDFQRAQTGRLLQGLDAS